MSMLFFDGGDDVLVGIVDDSCSWLYMALKKSLCDTRRSCVSRGLEERLGDLMI